MQSYLIWSAVEMNLLWWVICAIIASVIGAKKGRPLLGFLLGLLCGPIGILITLLIKGDHKQCPRCMERIHKKASICPYCRTEIPISHRELQLGNWIFGLIIAVGVVLCTAGIIVYLDGQPQKIITSNTAANSKPVIPPNSESDSARDTRRSSTLHRVKYEVTYSPTGGYIDEGNYLRMEGWSANLTYTNEQGGTSQESDANLTWSKTFLAERGQRLYISAQEGRGSRIGAITVWLYVDERLVKRSTSKGAYAIATASGRL